MKTLKDGNIAFYRVGRMLLLGTGVMGWLIAFLLFYFAIGQNNQVFYIALSILFFIMTIQLLFMVKFILPPVLVVSPQGIELSKKKNPTIFWDQITAVYRKKEINAMERLVFETVEGPVHTIPLIISNEDRAYLFRLLQEHNLPVQDYPTYHN